MKILQVLRKENEGKRYTTTIDGFKVVFQVCRYFSIPDTIDAIIESSIIDERTFDDHINVSLENAFILEDILNADYEEVV